MEGQKNCPYCGEIILAIAIKCKHCGSNLNQQSAEITLADQAANLSRGFENVGGRIKVTTKRILFQAHLFNLQNTPTEIPMDNIASISRKSSLGIIPNIMVVKLKSGLEYKFTVNGREKLIGLIEKALR